MKKQSFLLLLLPLFFAFSSLENSDNSCPAPSNVYVTAQSSSSITFDWDDCGCDTTAFKVKYYRHRDGYTSPESSTGSSNFTFNSLQAGTYTFYFWTDCGGEVSGIIVIEDIIEA